MTGTNPSVPQPRTPCSSESVERGLRVLVVDDHRAFAGALAAVLGSAGRFSHVAVAHTEPRAAAEPGARCAAPGRGPRRLLGSGADRGSPNASAEMVVLVVSGSDDTDDVVGALSRGASAWVPKGISVEGLMAAIDETLSRPTMAAHQPPRTGPGRVHRQPRAHPPCPLVRRGAHPAPNGRA